MQQFKYLDEADFAVTVCDLSGVILYMNNKSAATFASDGGFDLIGKSLINCHPESARSKLLDLLHRPRNNVYTIEKKNAHKMIYQTPWFENGKAAGLIEISLLIPAEIPNFVRK